MMKTDLEAVLPAVVVEGGALGVAVWERAVVEAVMEAVGGVAGSR